ncbi:GtrA family protein [Amycolatopsis sp. 195334CR]|uniref:GtrA family protein n=1 Tax=Amycolatopsis sp. 195334CR TaxID=2814588 RepID=UPI001A8E244B|nr:GtrA family protein [Amycolatopsis sp. 195334CR]MBN6033577.1 GtrA family protein [Amycolatopsis sp. 195334CR]
MAIPAPATAAPPTRPDGLAVHAGWYLAAGVVTTAVQFALYFLLRGAVGAHVANLLAIIVTTIGNTEFHRRVTFAGRNDAPRRRHLQVAGTIAFYAGYGSVVLLVLHAVVPAPAPLTETLVLATASLLGGVCRFALLRWWVFAHRHPDSRG